jgi:putative membrane protein
MSHGSWGAMGATWWGPLTLLLTVLVVVTVAVLWTRWNDGRARGDDALAELRRAYARGDLTDDEYERRRARLS